VQAGYQIRVTAFILDAALSWKNLNGLIYTQGGKTAEKRDRTSRNLIHIAIRFHSIFINC